MTASTPVDDFVFSWTSFEEFFQARGDVHEPYLVELDHETGARREWSVGQWRERVAETVAGLVALGVQPGDNVAALAGNSSDALALAYACWVSGSCYVPLNPHEPLERHTYIVADAQARLIVHSAAWEQRAAETATGTSARPVATAALHGGGTGSSPTRGPGSPQLSLDAPALRVYTSGTTGEPKGVVLTARNLLTDCDGLMQALEWAPETRVLTVLPIHHVNGLVISSLLPWYAGLSTVLTDRFRSERFWDDVARETATVCSVVPSLLEFLLAEQEAVKPACFREILCGAGPLMPDTVRDFESRFDVPVRHLYGLSETTAVATLMGRLPAEQRRSWYQDHRFPSIGPALPHVEVAIHDPSGAACPPGDRGEIVIRGATVMCGYAGKPGESAHALRDGWFHSGDEGFWLDGPGGAPYFFISGRLKELIIRGGVNISPLEIDKVICAHPAVRFGLAVPFENRYYGEEIAAYVVTQASVTEQEILDFCAQRLDSALRPKVVIFGDDVPFTSTGKAKRLTLKQSLANELARYRDTQFRRRILDAPRPTERSSEDA